MSMNILNWSKREVFMQIESVSLLNYFNNLNNQILKSSQKISTGKKINASSDNPAIYSAIKSLQKEVKQIDTQKTNIERLTNQKNTQQTKYDTSSKISMEIENLLDKAQSGAVSDEEKQAIQDEVNMLADELEDTLGTEVDASQFDVSSPDSLQNARNMTNDIINKAATTGSEIRQLNTQKQEIMQDKANLQSTISTLQDTDIIEEQINLTNKNILQGLAIKSIKTTANQQANTVFNILG